MRSRFPGLNALQFTNTPNYGVVFFGLKPLRRARPRRHEIAAELNMEFAQHQGGLRLRADAAAGPRPRQRVGLSTVRPGPRARWVTASCRRASRRLPGTMRADAGLGPFPISSYQANVPQLDARSTAPRPRQQGVALTDLFETLQVYLGSAYVNDFNLFGRTYTVYRAGRCAVPRRGRRHRSGCKRPQRARRDGADRRDW